MADANNQQGGDMTVREAGRKGGEKTSQEFGREHYQQIGHKGGEKVHDLVEKGKQVDESM